MISMVIGEGINNIFGEGHMYTVSDISLYKAIKYPKT